MEPSEQATTEITSMTTESVPETPVERQRAHRIVIGQGQTRRIHHRITVGDSTSEIFCAKFDPEDRYIACGYGDGVVRVFNNETGKLAFSLASQSYIGGQVEELPITCLKWRPQDASSKTLNVLATAHADGSLKHWHVTSGKCLHQRCDDPENHLYAIDYNFDGSLLAAAGRDCKIRIYDEATKSLAMTLHAGNDIPGHSNRVFCTKFDPIDTNLLLTGSWDNTMIVYDMRQKNPVKSMYGPHICGDSIDIRWDHTVLTGSYRASDCLQLWDLRMFKCTWNLNWDGGYNEPTAASVEGKSEPVGSEDASPSRKRKGVAPFIYSALFSKGKGEMIIAGGAGRNEVRVFDYANGNLIASVSDLEKSVLTCDYGNKSKAIAFGSSDSCLRIMDILES